MNFKKNILEAIGNTPLVRLNKINKGLKPQIFAKLESTNPGGSVKDRIGIQMLTLAEEAGQIKPGGTLVEATSGNTGIGLALAASVKGYKSVFVVTDKVSAEKINYLRALGSEVIVCPNSVKHDSPDYYITVARKIASETHNALFMYQYSNPGNPLAHYRTTGPEIWEQTEGKITHFVAGMGTGGTISGTGKFLKEKNPNIQIVGADPKGSILKTFKETGKMSEGIPYLVEGIGQDCIPENVHFQYIDRVITVPDVESFDLARRMSKEEGIFCGGSTGTILHAALEIAKEGNKDDIIVFIVCDTGERYLTKMHSEEWLRQKRMLKHHSRTVRDISYSKKILKPQEMLFVHCKDKIKTAVEKMDATGFSQLPVMDFGESVGSLREAKVMSSLLENPKLLDCMVEEIMEPGFPTIDEKSDLQSLKHYLTESPAVLVTEYGRIIDIITRYDILEFSESIA